MSAISAFEAEGETALVLGDGERGQVYENPAARLVHTPGGVFCRVERPVEYAFFRSGAALAEAVDRHRARRELWEAMRLVEDGGFLLVVYDERRFFRNRPQAGSPMIRPPECFVYLGKSERRLLFYTGEEFLFFRFGAGVPVLPPLRE